MSSHHQRMKASNPNSNQSVPRVPAACLSGHDGPVQVVRFTDSGKYCVTGGYDRTVRLWNPARLDPAIPVPPSLKHSQRTMDDDEGTPLSQLPRSLCIQTYTDGMAHPISALAVSEDASSSSILAAASDRVLVVTDLITQRCLRRLQGHYGRINAVAFGPFRHTYLTASYDATVRIWDARSYSTHEPIQILKDAKDSVTDIHVVCDDEKETNSANQTTLIRTASVDGCVRTYDLRKGIVTCDHVGGGDSPITAMAPTHDGKCLVVSCLDGIIRLIEASGTTTACTKDEDLLLNTYLGHHQAGNYNLQCSVTADDRYVCTGSEHGSAVFYDMITADCVQLLKGHSKPVCSIAPHPKEGGVLVTGGYDGIAVVWANRHDFVRWQE